MIFDEDTEFLYLESSKIFTIPESLEKLKNLKYLGLGNNQISVIPEFFEKLEDIYWFSLAKNNISIIVKNAAVVHIHLGNNRIVNL